MFRVRFEGVDRRGGGVGILPFPEESRAVRAGARLRQTGMQLVTGRRHMTAVAAAALLSHFSSASVCVYLFVCVCVCTALMFEHHGKRYILNDKKCVCVSVFTLVANAVLNSLQRFRLRPSVLVDY